MIRRPIPLFRGRTGFKHGHKPGEMNSVERKYAALLAVRELAGEVIWWSFEGIRFVIAPKLQYTPDFNVMLKDGTMEMIDVKGGMVDPRSTVKLRAAAAKFPMFTFAQEQLQTKKNGGGFKRIIEVRAVAEEATYTEAT